MRALLLLLVLLGPGCATTIVWHLAGLDGRRPVVALAEARAAREGARTWVLELTWSDGDRRVLRWMIEPRASAQANYLGEPGPRHGMDESTEFPDDAEPAIARIDGPRPRTGFHISTGGFVTLYEDGRARIEGVVPTRFARPSGAQRLWLLLAPASIPLDAATLPLQLLLPLPTYYVMLLFGAADLI